MSQSKDDMLREMFRLREKFMLDMDRTNPDIYPEWPVNLTEKRSQQVLRDTALKGVEEMFEALQHLKNWKPHKKTEVSEFNRDEFLEEIVDAFNYFLSLLVLTGVTSDELFDAYCKKDSIIHERLKSGYLRIFICVMENVRQYNRYSLEERAVYEPSEGLSQRFDLRAAGSQISDPIVSAILNSWKSRPGSLKASVSYDTVDFLYTDELSPANNKALPIPSGEYFDALSDLDFDVIIYTSQHPDVDANYLHSGDISDEGLIEVIISVPEDRRAAKMFLTTLRIELRAALAHEMQHAIQRIIYGNPLDTVTNLDLDDHMNHPMEIDARVEENIAYLEDNIDEKDLDEFINKLSVYVEKYLARNAPNASNEELDVYRSRMMDSHTTRYVEKMGLKSIT